ncbi:MAG: YciI family protein [Pseudanabaena sp.]|jgi:uncharacterized protein YciI|uniref:YciI family protein n=1 Tax=Pseudanabaena mucicola TaxID=71190 RepID=UPI00257849AF|nr:YciI family protein [Pseudanabaena mucicola]MCA6575673.1 hypothetical protein [Pseudanabaena sp. M53BS1SP1A06MG]MCA6582314.1 hypothetical protein [Pseudanabaena sp. M34BS1SP1A06MG]MCA6587010.1 hypothetical protein [Pseudanabaena sp. M051S1SP1A06QC]MCA6589249.1 hypothetical protein [Pseudanabaena sp. M109S1SP1A06QC]MCA6594115.1 hypothetical protein [Pseudanabaena sp. M38BS1SP1A06MG]MCA6598390.1 hypothetical protein [Pseudanabaena sp. M046S1SP1A06QC]MCA6601837.1 hypothetical protein [Pseuda
MSQVIFGIFRKLSTELKKFVVWGSYCENVIEKRAPFRQAHLDNLKALHESGKLLSIGPTQDITKVFAVYVAHDLNSAKQLVEADPYWQHGIWTDYEVYEWLQVY